MDGETFLQRVAQAARAGRAYRVGGPPQAEWVGYVGAAGDLCESLAREILAVGGEATIVENDDAARQQVIDLLRRGPAQQALLWQHPLLERLALRELLAGENVKVIDHASLETLPVARQRSKLLAADVGISSVDFAVAETGTLVVASRPGQERVASLTPPVHIALVDASQIVPDLFDVFTKLDAWGWGGLPSNLAFITGPSKTGDIELQLTTGVHGPGRWHVVIVRGRAP